MQFSYLGAKIRFLFELEKLLESFLFIFSGAEEAKTIYFHSFFRPDGGKWPIDLGRFYQDKS
jgi:hypothetical protein